MPETVRMSRTDIQSHTRFPIIARPVDSHAGRGLTKFETAEAVDVYLAGRPGEHDAALRAAGVSEFVFAGSDALASLQNAWRWIEGS